MIKRLTAVRVLGLVSASLMLAACSSDQKLREPVPAPKVSADSKQDLDKSWSRRLDATDDHPSGVFMPVIDGPNVYAAASDGEIASFLAADGDENWQMDLDEPLNSGVGFGPAGLAVSTRSGAVILLSTSGEQRWRTELGHEILQPPLVTTNMVIVQSSSGSVIALNKSGEILWRYQHTSLPLTLRGTNRPVVYRDRVLVGFASGHLVALKTTTGDLLWDRKIQIARGTNEFERLIDLNAPMTLRDNVVYVPGYQGFLTAVEAFTGQVLWQKEISSFQQATNVDKTLFITDSDSNLIALEASSGDRRWQSEQLLYRRTSAPVHLGNTVLLTDLEGKLYALSAETAQVLAREKAGKAPVTLIATSKFVLTQDTKGKLIRWDLITQD